MSRRRVVLLVSAALALLGCDDPRPRARAKDAPTEAASGSASASASASGDVAVAAAVATPEDTASASASAKKPPPPPRVRKLDPPAEAKSPLPKPKEWTDIPRRQLVHRPEYDCTLELLRDWARITCNTQQANVMLVTGSKADVYLFASAETSQAIFPVRRGDARVFEFHPNPKFEAPQSEYGGPTEVSGGEPAVVSELWLEGEDAPTIVVQ